MRLSYILWVLALAIAIIVGLSKFAAIGDEFISPILMRDSTLSLFVALALSLISKWVR